MISWTGASGAAQGLSLAFNLITRGVTHRFILNLDKVAFSDEKLTPPFIK